MFEAQVTLDEGVSSQLGMHALLKGLIVIAEAIVKQVRSAEQMQISMTSQCEISHGQEQEVMCGSNTARRWCSPCAQQRTSPSPTPGSAQSRVAPRCSSLVSLTGGVVGRLQIDNRALFRLLDFHGQREAAPRLCACAST